MVVTDDVPGAFAREVISAFVERPGEEFDIALSGGEIARACYERLAVDGAQAVDWLVVNFFWVDELLRPAEPSGVQRAARPPGSPRAGRGGQRRLPHAL